ncbi:MAG: ABC transporter substrate-binding protein [Deltaproteobacteria bacterium]|nr:ABC transporter substrate-binding protein [Deltaproteobacteria bacterium]
MISNPPEMPTGKLRMAPACYHVLHLVPVMVAHEMNFFYDEGLKDAEGNLAYEIAPGGLVPFGFEKAGLVKAMEEKGIDIALDILTPTVFFQRSRGADLYIIAGWRNQSAHVWVGGPEVKSLRDLKGRRIGVIEIGGVTYRGIKTWVRKAGLDPDRDVEWIAPVYPPSNIDALRKGAIHAVFVHSWQAEELKREGFNILISLKEQYPNGRPDRIIAASGKTIESRPDLVKGFLKGMIRAYWYMRDQPKNFEYVYNLERRLRRQSPNADERRSKQIGGSPRQMEAMPFPIDGLPTGFEELLEEEKEAGELDFNVPDVKDVCDLNLVKEAFKELKEREELKAEFERVSAVVRRLGY